MEYSIGDKVIVRSTVDDRSYVGEGTIDSEHVEGGYFVKTHPVEPATFYYDTEIVDTMGGEDDEK